jgi:glycosyltransferase involved in cell wall biosynthesis
VQFTGPLPYDAIATHAESASFYLQASLTEGMALSVVEAMQMGLIPAVRPAGEIARYARDGQSAVFLSGDARADAARIMALIDAPDDAAAMARAARAEWAEAPLYRDAVLAACAALDAA